MAKKLWGGRFKKKIDKDFFEFQKSIQYDHKLAKYDIFHSLIHTLALGWAGVLKPKEKARLIKSLKKIREEIKSDKFKYDINSEDIQTDIQNKVEKRIGKLALKLHTLRSRNDQIAFDEKLYCYYECADIEKMIRGFMESILFLRDKYKKLFIVGYTHTQRAQKIYFKDYLGAFYYMFERDKKRLINFWKDLEIHIGAGALARGIEKEHYNKAIREHCAGKNIPIPLKPSENTVDDVSDRDFIIEFLSILSIIQMHLSRLSEDFILYSTKEFGFMELPEEFCTGSSMMPHKKNPDFLELVRGYTGRIYGNLISILTTMKGLPLTYNRDMQLDKEPLFSSVEIVKDEISIMSKFVKGVRLNECIIKEALKDRNLYSVDRAKDLVKQGMSFRQAHDEIGRGFRKK
ncbi:MAG: argininosuccinate lyase [Candidatus Omnitrophica bacterium]|nr:argininosuccinate lyase [Candidatus Omnitrophota bacterium]